MACYWLGGRFADKAGLSITRKGPTKYHALTCTYALRCEVFVAEQSSSIVVAVPKWYFVWLLSRSFSHAGTFWLYTTG